MAGKMSIPRTPMPLQEADERICNFTEVALGYTRRNGHIGSTALPAVQA